LKGFYLLTNYFTELYVVFALALVIQWLLSDLEY